MMDTTTTGGYLYVPIWVEFPDVTSFEYGCARASPPDPGLLRPEQAVLRVAALRDARGGRPDLSDGAWQRCVGLVYPTLNEEERQSAEDILTAVGDLRPPQDNDETVAEQPRGRSGEAPAGLAQGTPGRPAWTRALFEGRWEKAYALTEEPRTIPNVAVWFEALDGTVGIDPEYLRDLRRRWRRHELPE
jgi:hypothetical protein